MRDLTSEFVYLDGTRSRALATYRALEVERYHTQGDVPGQTLRDHSAGVAILVMQIWPETRPEVVCYALVHDLGEKSTGDLPYYAKMLLAPESMCDVDEVEGKYLDHLQVRYRKHDLNPEENAKVKICDYLELSLYCDKFATRGARQIGQKGWDLIPKIAENLSRIDIIKLNNTFREMCPGLGQNVSFSNTWSNTSCVEVIGKLETVMDNR